MLESDTDAYATTSLPYGLLITRILLYYSIDLSEHLMVEVSAIYDSKIFSSIGYVLLDTEWCKKDSDKAQSDLPKHVLQHGKPHERSDIKGKLTGQIVKMSQHKYASNVVEKCLIFATPKECQVLVNEMLGSTLENEPLQSLIGLVRSYRYDKELVDPDMANADATILREAIQTKQLDNDNFLIILSTRNVHQRRAIFLYFVL
ncbi:hypothetical protein T459_02134 [Capsicum annuum]|uniref:Uncharacterized protein n=1 Tax=Capsicum annuum TaxID=4072 RepID=A0A2G3AJ47_CAPAN|nr:hypothetical protein T459_02134 [Capsicum annuum]